MSNDVRRCSISQKNKNGTVWHCPREFSIAEHGDYKTCPYHRAKSKRHSSSAKGKAAQARYAKTEKGVAKRVRHSKTETFKAAQKKFRQSEKGLAGSVKHTAKYRSTEHGAATVRAYTASDKGKALHRAYQKSSKGRAAKRRYNATERGKIAKKKQDNKPMNQMARSIRKMMLGTHENPVSVPKLGCFQTNDDVSVHMESTFDDWMHWGNHGTMPGVQKPKTMWQMGHRLPKAIFDAAVFEDMKRCWHARNLFAQCAKENMENGARCVLSDTELIALRDLWPLRANDDLATLKSLFVA